MLVYFEVGNFRSFRDPVQFSMVAAAPFKEFQKENTFEAHGMRLLRSAVIYGANASGKSNLLLALEFMRKFVLSSAKESQSTEPIAVNPFKLDTATENAPSRFEIVFIVAEIRYRYGFEVDAKAVRSEWLYAAKSVKESALFLRKDDGIEVFDDFKEGRGLEQHCRDNSLFLSTVDLLNGATSKTLLKWFFELEIIRGSLDILYQKRTIDMFSNATSREQLLRAIRSADIGIEHVNVEEIEYEPSQMSLFNSEVNKELSKSKYKKISTVHTKFSKGKRVGNVKLDLQASASEGTKKYFNMLGPIVESLQRGLAIAIDEMDAKLHPLLTREIVRLFHTPSVNTKNAQLIFGTHDTNLLTYGKFRRDQIWFTEKNRFDATDLYSLAEFKLPKGKKVRKDASFEKDYIKGRYGAIPYLGNFAALFAQGGADGPGD